MTDLTILAEVSAAFQGGCSSVTILTTSQGTLVRKQAPPELLAREAAALHALAAYVPFVPDVIAHDDTGLITRCLPGENGAVLVAAAHPSRRLQFARAFGAGLRTIHGFVPTGVPRPDIDWIDAALETAGSAAGRYDGAAIDNPPSPWHGRPAGAALAFARTTLMGQETRWAFCHGDWCLPNALVVDGAVTGAVDWGDALWADRRTDLAMGLWSLRFNLKEDVALDAYLEAFLDAYGFDGAAADLRAFEALYDLQ